MRREFLHDVGCVVSGRVFGNDELKAFKGTEIVKQSAYLVGLIMR